MLAPGTARHAALDDALTEIDAGAAQPSPRWKVRYGLMLGLERVLAAPQPATAAGTELRRHQIDALAGMLAELIAANQRERGRERQRQRDRRARAGGDDSRTRTTRTTDVELDDEDEDGGGAYHGARPGRIAALSVPPPDRVGQDDRRRRVRRGIAPPRHPDPHPPAPARHPVHPRPDDEGYGDRLTRAIEKGAEPLRDDPITIQTYAWFARHSTIGEPDARTSS